MKMLYDEDVVELKISLINDEDEDGGNAAWGRKKRRGLNWDDYNDSMIYMCKYMYLIIVDMCIMCDDQI